MVNSTKKLGPEKDYADEGQQYIQKTTHPLIREGAPGKEDRDCQRVKNIWS
jgi:hypothetical protein